MYRANILIVCSDVVDLAAMTAVLSSDHNVVAVHTVKEASFPQFRPFRPELGFIEVGTDAEASVSNILELGKDGMHIVVLFRPPCPQPVVEAVANGKIHGLCRIPVDLELFILQARTIIGQLAKKSEQSGGQRRILTREEVAYLLGADKWKGKS
ncbi:hypothetical protein [Solidesulfovibrio fructosivorans]|uniref:hypothetical protein n=1 Tax=Solidesulfovibrio fructosivorans TaxID=878 RepID=UPI00117D59AE|nr:hypothetical protein [Solidesulfovibrio fructosivorans]